VLDVVEVLEERIARTEMQKKKYLFEL
jgi:hypothetical protein